MADLQFQNLHKVYPGDIVAVDDFTLRVPSPQMLVLVGPSGCGKTTLLRMVAGLETPTSGTIHLGDTRLDTLEPRRRDIAMVFQSYALYPHMSVADNLSFGLRLRKTPRAEVKRRVQEVAQQLEIDPLLGRKPGELSGGQRQRVAPGRAVIREPRVFLFDEPLSNLDARLRTDMRTMIRRLYDRLQVTSIYVTHDQVEAMTIGERLVIMNEGRVRQVGTPEQCYHEPADTFVASFLGSPSMNLFEASFDASTRRLMTGGAFLEVDDTAARRIASVGGERIVFGVRPEHVLARTVSAAAVSGTGRLMLREPLGHETLTHIALGDGEIVARGQDEFAPDGAGAVSVSVEARHLHLFSAADGSRLGPEGAAG
jgi:ABC-type sugar transport system ATPase subunit